MPQVLCSQLVGRDEELTLLRDALARARAGQGSAVVLLGEAGVGKSRLSREVEASALGAGMCVLSGRSVEGSADAYRPLAEALLGGIRACRLPDADELAPFRHILGRLIPAWRSESTPVVDNPAVMLGEGILRFLRAFAEREPSERGCLLVLEDLHWADADTLSVIEYMIDNLQQESVLLLTTVRYPERSTALGLARSLGARRAARIVEISHLDTKRVEDMAQLCLELEDCPQPFIERLTSYTGGLPFLVEELLAAWIDARVLVRGPAGWEIAEELPPIAPVTFSETVQQRLQTLGNETARLLQAAALLGREFDSTILPEVVGLDQPATIERLRAAIGAQLIVTAGIHNRNSPGASGPFAFRHALTQAAVLATLLPPEREFLSRRLLTAIEHEYEGLPGEWCDVAARLAEDAGESDRAAELLLQSGRRARTGGALATAEHVLDLARALHRRESPLTIDIAEALTEVLALAGKWESVLEVGGRLLRSLERASAPPSRRAEVYLRIARATLAAGRWADAAEQIAHARELAGAEPILLAQCNALAAHLAIERGRLAEAEAFAGEALACAERADLPEVACEALEALGRCRRVGDLDGAEATFERARIIAEEHNLPLWRMRALHELGTLDIFRTARADRLLAARELAVNLGALATAAMLDVQAAAAYDQRPEPEPTLRLARRAEDLARRLHLDITAALALVFEAQAHAKRGDRQRMEAAIAAAHELAPNDPSILVSAREGRAFAAAVDDNWDEAVQELEAGVEYFEAVAATAPGPFYGLWALLRTMRDMDGEAACRLVRESGALVSPLNEGFVYFAEAIIRGRRGAPAEAANLVSRGDAAMRGLDWYRHLGRRLVAEAAIIDGWGEPAVWLTEACLFFEMFGSGRLATACRSLLHKTGRPAPRAGRARAGVPEPLRARGVTQREMEVLALLAEGLTNKELGQRLYVSPRTVEKHVASLMVKTDTHSRVQLAALAVTVARDTAVP